MPRTYGMYKPGERAPQSGAFYCYVCALRQERSTCEVEAGALFVQCPRCLERKVAEWDMVWKPVMTDGSRRDRRTPAWWPGSLARRV